jgi:hypothetical protein
MSQVSESERPDQFSIIREVGPGTSRIVRIRAEADELSAQFLESQQYVPVEDRRPAVIVNVCLGIDLYGLAFVREIFKHRVEDIAEIAV